MMDFSEEWKSMWSVSSVFGAPLLYSGAVARPLGPLFFRPNLGTNLLRSSPSLCQQMLPPDPYNLRYSIQAFYRSSKLNFVPSHILNFISFDAISSRHCSDDNAFHNTLQILRRSTGDLILFFPTGDNADRIGYVLFSSSNHKILISKDGDIFKQRHGLHHHILKFFVIGANAIAPDSSSLPLSSSSNSLTEGFLLACTLYSVHWFAVETTVSHSGDLDMPVLVHLASAEFGIRVQHACWSPHMQGESAVLLDNGELRLFDLDSCSGAMKLPMKLRGSRFIVWPNDASGGGGGLVSEKGGWLSCEFGWHPRILMVSCSTAVFLVDLRFERGKVTVLAKIEMCDSFRVHSLQTDRFIAFCKAGFNDFFFSVATEHHLLLFDVRQPLTPILQWDHGLDNPCYIHMLKLSELRPSAKDGEFKWASDSGFAVLLGSFWNCQFSIFCFGPSLQVSNKSIVSGSSKLCNSLYAWELPSSLSLLGCKCHCGNCLLREDFSKVTLPVGIDWHWVKEMVLGFCIVSEDLSVQNSEGNVENASATNGLGGFTLIRLSSSGKLETQRYQASWDFIGAKCNEEDTSCFKDSLLNSCDQEDTVYSPYVLAKFDYLFGCLSGNLANVLAAKLQNSCQNRSKTKYDAINTVYCTQDSRELICNTLKAAGIGQIGSPLKILNVLNGINFPTSIYEIASERIWAGLSLDLLQLAFFRYADIIKGQGKYHVEFLDIPALPNMQLPPFFLRKPTQRGEKWLGKGLRGAGLVGPVLPIQVLLTLQQLERDESSSGSKKEVDGIFGEAEVTHQCNEVTKVVNNLLHNEADSVSLSDDNDKWVASQEMQDKNPFLLYETQAFLNTTLCREKNTDAGYSVKVVTEQMDQESTPQQKNTDAGYSVTVETDHMDQGSTPTQATSEFVFEGKKFTTFISRKQEVATSDAGMEQVGLEMFDDLSPVQLKFDSPAMNFEPEELKIYRCLKRQFSKWQDSFKPFEDFCTSSKLPKGY